MTTMQAQRLCAPARQPQTDADPQGEAAAAAAATDLAQMDALFDEYSRWLRTRAFYSPHKALRGTLGPLQKRTRPYRQPPSAACSSSMAALHLAILAQPADAIDARVFWSHYGARAANIKVVADALGISRQHYYRLLAAFCRRVVIAAKQIEGDNLLQAANLPHAASAA